MDLVAEDFLTRLRAFVRRRVTSSADADDVVQTVLLRWLQSSQQSPAPAPHAWLVAAAKRAIIDLHRSRGRTDETADVEREVVEASDEERSDIGNCLAPLLATLPDEDRELLLRVDVEGASQTALAREFGITPSGLKSRVQRARTRLRAALTAHCIVDRDPHGHPVGPATCRPDPSGSRTPSGGCGCG